MYAPASDLGQQHACDVTRRREEGVVALLEEHSAAQRENMGVLLSRPPSQTRSFAASEATKADLLVWKTSPVWGMLIIDSTIVVMAMSDRICTGAAGQARWAPKFGPQTQSGTNEQSVAPCAHPAG